MKSIVQRQVGNQHLELLVLVPQLPQPTNLGGPEAIELPIPAVERLIGDLKLVPDLAHRVLDSA